ncbi:hypothetical protein Aduo_004520 [Ancylostoma duodenale]
MSGHGGTKAERMVRPLSQLVVGHRSRAGPSLLDGRSPPTRPSRNRKTGSERSPRVGNIGTTETDNGMRVTPRMSSVIAPPHVGTAMTRHDANPGNTGKTATVRTSKRHCGYDHHGRRTGGAAKPVRLTGTA